MIDLTGKMFGELTVIGRSVRKSKSREWYWLCQCSCGNTKEIIGRNLRGNRTLDQIPIEHKNKILDAANKFKTHWACINED